MSMNKDLKDPRMDRTFRKSLQTFLFSSIGLVFPVIVPFFHIGIFLYLWKDYNRNVDRNLCSCSCWDTVFKGTYETGLASYKHIYFNATSNTFKIWFSTVVAVILFYESVKYLARLIYTGQIRWPMFVLYAASVYPHYYSWWSYFNYLNDDFYSQWYHQTYFSLTEMASTLAVLYLADKRRKDNLVLSVLVILVVALAHICISSFDQLVSNVILGAGGLHQVIRDIGMAVPDLLNVTLSLMTLRTFARSKRVPATHLVSNRQFFSSVAFILLSWLLCYSI